MKETYPFKKNLVIQLSNIKLGIELFIHVNLPLVLLSFAVLIFKY